MLTRRAVPLLLFAGYVAATLTLTLTRQPAIAEAVIAKTISLLTLLGAPATLASHDRIEVVFNLLLLIPLPMIGMLVWSRTNWRDWTAYAVLISLVLELIQIPMPHRDAAFSDVVANSAGALIGGLFMALLNARRRRRKAVLPTHE